MTETKTLKKSDLLEYTLFRTKVKSRGTGCGFLPEKFIAVLCEFCTDSPEFAEEHDIELAPFIIMSYEERLDLNAVRRHFEETYEGQLTAERSGEYLAAALEAAEVESAEQHRSSVSLSSFINAVLRTPTADMREVFGSDRFKCGIRNIVYDDYDDCFDDEDVYYCDDEYVDETEEYTDDDDTAQEQQTTTVEEVIRKLDENGRKQVAELADSAERMRAELSKRILGQDNAVKSFADGYFRSKLDRLIEPYSSNNARPGTPMTFVFAGAPGVGKTMLAKLAADVLGISPLLYNMSEGFDAKALMSYAENEPEGMVIFDEIEKAGPSTLESFLPVLDSGYYRGVPCGGLTMIFTTNAGRSLYENESIPDLSELPKSVLLDAVEKDSDGAMRMKLFPPELISRLSTGNIVMFRMLDPQSLLSIASTRYMEKMSELSGQMRCSVNADDSVFRALIFSTAGSSGARAVIGAAGEFFAKSTYSLTCGRNEEEVFALDSINVTVDVPPKGEIAELFGKDIGISVRKLFCSGKELCFSIECSIDTEGRSAEIRMTELKLRTAMQAEDMDIFLGPVTMPDVRFDDVIGGEEVKEELRQAVTFLKDPGGSGLDPELFSGILMNGPPGTGKTMLAKALASESGVPFIATEGNRFLKRYVGDSSESVHEIFRKARKYAPCVLFIDEVECIARSRTGSEFTHVREEVLTALLTEMNGFGNDPDRPVYVVAATNFPTNKLDPAFIRRFDKSVTVGLPKRAERERFLELAVADSTKFGVSGEMLKNIAARSVGMSLAHLGKFCALARRMALRRNSLPVSDELFDEAFECYNAGSEKKRDDVQRERTAYHEAGHTVISLLTGGRPSYVTIIARDSFGGYVQEEEKECPGTMTAEGMYDKICMYLGGRAGERALLGALNGCSSSIASDIAAATQLASDMVCRYAMRDDFGLAALSEREIQGELAVKVNTAVNGILAEQMRRAEELLAANRALLDRIARELLENDRLSGKEVMDLYEESRK